MGFSGITTYPEQRSLWTYLQYPKGFPTDSTEKKGNSSECSEIFKQGSYRIIGQIINVPIDLEQVVSCFPRDLDEDYAFNVSLKKNMLHKSGAFSGYEKKK